jgi:hypothetical protein
MQIVIGPADRRRGRTFVGACFLRKHRGSEHGGRADPLAAGAVSGRGADLCWRPWDGQEQGQARAREAWSALHHGPHRSADSPFTGRGGLQLELFSEQICEVEQEGIRYLLRKNEDTEAREKHRLEDKLARLERLIKTRNTEVEQHPRCKPEAGLRKVEKWGVRHKVNGLVQIALEGDKLSMERKQEAIQHSLELAGC